MATSDRFLAGEHTRNLDDRYRLSIPSELIDPLLAGQTECVLAKEQPGCLSLWDTASWQQNFDTGMDIIRAKLKSGRLGGQLGEAQQLGRLLSSRHREVQLAGRGRLVVPEGFREFLRVEPGGEVIVVGAAVCIEIWHPRAWLRYLRKQIPNFRRLFDQLSR